MRVIAVTLLSSLLVFVNGSPVSSPITLSLTRTLNLENTHTNTTIIHRDQNRVKLLKNKSVTGNEPVTNAIVTYTASVGVGSPATDYTLLIDTGSSNTWVGAGKSYVKTSTSKKTSDSVSVTYGSGSFSGTEYTDTVTLGSKLKITKQSIGVASSASGFSNVDGILGIGPVDLTEGTLSPHTTKTIPTVTDNLADQGVITKSEIGIYYSPYNTGEKGELTWGGADTSKIDGSVHYAPLTTTYPASAYWGVDQSITYGSGKKILSSTAGIVDTGTTLILLASDAYNRYVKQTGAVLDSATGLLRITTTQFKNLESLHFHINGESYALTPDAQIWPRSLNTALGGVASHIYLIVGDLGSPSGEGLDFINGYTFLERFYTVYDTTNQRVGFAKTAHTSDKSNY